MRKHRQYVSPATASIAIQLDAGTVSAQNVGAGDPGCASANGNVTCTIEIAGKAGINALIVETLDRPNSGTSSSFAGLNGSVLSSATLSVVLSASAAATVYSTSLNGVPANILIAPAPGQTNVTGTQSTGFTFTTASGSAQFIVVALDADGNPIVGPGAPVLAAASVPSGLTLTPVANSQDLYTASFTAGFLGGSLAFDATQIGPGNSPVSAAAAVKGDVALIAVTQTGQLGLWALSGATNQISVYNVSTPSSPQLVATLPFPACPSGSAQYGANAVFDSSWNIVTGYFCTGLGTYPGGLLVYPLNGESYATTPAVLDSTHAVALVAVYGSSLDAETFDGANNPGNVGVYAYDAASKTATLSGPLQSPCSLSCGYADDMMLVNGDLFINYLDPYIAAQNTLSAGTPYAALDGTFGVAIDGSGNVWLSTNSLPSNDALSYSGPEIAETNGTTGNILGSSLPSPLTDPLGIDFDVNGNLWVVDESGIVAAYVPGPNGTFASRRQGYRRFGNSVTPLAEFTLPNAVYVRAAR